MAPLHCSFCCYFYHLVVVTVSCYCKSIVLQYCKGGNGATQCGNFPRCQRSPLNPHFWLRNITWVFPFRFAMIAGIFQQILSCSWSLFNPQFATAFPLETQLSTSGIDAYYWLKLPRTLFTFQQSNHSPNVWWPWQHLLLHERFSFNSPVAQNDNNGDQTRLPSGSFPSISGQHFSDHYLSSPAGICRCPNLLWHWLLPHPDPAAVALLTVVINVRPPPNTLDHSQESPRPTSDRAVT